MTEGPVAPRLPSSLVTSKVLARLKCASDGPPCIDHHVLNANLHPFEIIVCCHGYEA